MKSEPWSQWLAQTCSRHARAESALGKECRRAEGAPSVPYPLPPPSLSLSLSPLAARACRLPLPYSWNSTVLLAPPRH